ncbi:50S ribosomal protein L11 methyltransferase [Porphyrobacter sp. GA68]|uniref:50S ribosomal protein L11 methyltransferase n=1 Tax=Porphyrobacter sp. GA68 TaxID=2883480 RepID=UPI001D1861C2|nr:50S ribosomal protein L11 methyltransferase [Porphyrobacter sp. GA68]
MSGDSWKITAIAPRQDVESALAALGEDERMVLSGREVAEDSADWVLEAWLPSTPDETDLARFAALLPARPDAFRVEQLAEQDWVTLSQQGLDPVETGRFRVRTPDHPATDDPAIHELIIPAAQAFGTGQHATTKGCLAMLDRMEHGGVRPRSMIDVGTGTGLLAFAALRLWPDAMIAASDIDPVCEEVLRENAALNRIPLGSGPGEILAVTAPGMDDPVLTARGPYDLLVANILAGPLVELADDFGHHTAPGGDIVLSGLLTSQQDVVAKAYEQRGFRLMEAAAIGDWAILRLRQCAGHAGS